MSEGATGPGSAGVASCPTCSGTGFLTEVGDAGMRYARRCDCRRINRKGLLESATRIPSRYRHCELGSLETFNNASLVRAVETCRKIADDFPTGRHGLLLLGPCGVGKTHLGVALLRLLVEKFGARGLFSEAYDLLRRIQQTYDRRSETAMAEVLTPALEADVLLLDDLGASRMTPWARDTFGQIINERYNHSRLTLLTSNRSDESAPDEESLSDRIGERLTSRLAEMCWTVRIEADDFRRTYRQGGFHP